MVAVMPDAAGVGMRCGLESVPPPGTIAPLVPVPRNGVAAVGTSGCWGGCCTTGDGSGFGADGFSPLKVVLTRVSNPGCTGGSFVPGARGSGGGGGRAGEGAQAWARRGAREKARARAEPPHEQRTCPHGRL